MQSVPGLHLPVQSVPDLQLPVQSVPGLQLPVQSVPISTAEVVSSNPVHGEVYSIQYYVIICQ